MLPQERKKDGIRKVTTPMDKVNYYGLYSTMVGAVSVSLLSEPQNDAKFPPGIFYKDASWRFVRYYRASTPKQVENLEQWAKDSQIELGVTLTF